MRADIHPMNQERLQTLRDFGVLDTDHESDLDEIVQLASEICEMPMSLISLVDEDRQWFKAKVGMQDDATPIDQAICAHAILKDEILEINDTLIDPRTADNPLCTGDDPIRFYAGAPLVASNGMPIGTLCVLDDKPRELTDLQRKTLSVLSRQVMKQLDLRIALRNQEILQSEADHRVKNSLQSMSAIVRVYTRTISDDAAVEALGAIQRRIDAIAALHLELQSTDGRNAIDTGAYLDRVVALLQDTAPENITVSAKIAPIVMRSDHAANLAMIIGEFVANSIKHAFPDGRKGEICVSLLVTDLGQYRLECRDNGIGNRGSEPSPTRTTGIGLSLVSAAASNLGGTTNTDMTPDGSQLIVDFGDAPVEQTADLPQRQAEEG
ncbi:putative signal transduction histidine kinase with GAF domain [Sulfitobacter noctilucicola]|uniref:Two-component sensor histidine kinase n=1 Tax=Sulfitobacter noctilucicola TaxID=1342301 RepID=A0A7W6Q4K8_9RHOB|nr:histidine kinase dimerization/phosphoacceptor domain -containing protein [Sulfitobacter noctilucicola]KIN62641.1 putative signal transduction histidine kinase with GAF domain [Sulfitobacter noctilucicola]MBB4172825.1 two-component sensor histidine kinase [Sulfitobacter noctilucicola]